MKIFFLMLLALVTSGCYSSTGLRNGDTATLEQSLSYGGTESFTLQLSPHLDGDLQTEYREPGLPETDFLDDIAFTYTSVRINFRGSGDEYEPRATLCARLVNKVTREFDRAHGDFYSAETVFVDALPDIEKLKSFTNLKQFTDLLGPQRRLTDGWWHGWKVFTVTGESEVTVMSIVLYHMIGNDTVPLGLMIETGIFKERSENAG